MKNLIMIITNTATGTFHPIVYLEKVMPGNVQPSETTIRFQSKFHHTEGFTTIEEAVTNINEDLAPKILEHFPMYSQQIIDTESIGEWDGDGIPASIIFYDCSDKQTVIC